MIHKTVRCHTTITHELHDGNYNHKTLSDFSLVDSSKNFQIKCNQWKPTSQLLPKTQQVGLAVGVVILCIGAGTLALYYIEHLDWMDSFYLSVMSVTTVGYGDRAFKTLEGRIFASFWLLVSTLAVARAFLYLAEARIDKRHRRIAKWVLQRDLTVEDLFAADINHCGFIR